MEPLREMGAAAKVVGGMDTLSATGRASLIPWSYRDAEAPLRARRRELIAAQRAEIAALDPQIPKVYERRLARTVAAVVAIAGTAGLPIVTLIVKHGLTTWLVGTVVAAVVAWWVALPVARRTFARRIAQPLEETADLHGDLARLEEQSALGLVAARIDRLERASVALPLVALSLLAPLVIHFAVYALLVRPLSAGRGLDFDDWIRLSLMLVSHAHLVLAAMALRFAKRLRRAPSDEIQLRTPSAWSAWGAAVGAAAIPGALLLLIPPLLVAATGAMFVPAMFNWARRQVWWERGLIER